MNKRAMNLIGGAAVLGAFLAVGGCSDMRSMSPPPAAPPAAARCADVQFPVYFQDGSDALTPAAQKVLTSAVARVRGCTVSSGEIVGLASAGPAAAADELSQRRAVRVAEALTAAGVPGPALQLKAAGDEGATGPGGHAAPMRHAAQVFLHFAPS